LDAPVDRNPALVVVLEGDLMTKIVAIDDSECPCGTGGYLSKAWGVAQQIARIQLTRGHDRSGAE
jgi:hypothetical protein